MRLGDVVEQSGESWDGNPARFGGEFPYIEISAVGLGTDDYTVEMVLVDQAPSRARMIVRPGDIIMSTTRPHRGAIARIRPENEGAIASTGFAVLRNVKTPTVNKDYLLSVLLSPLVLRQFLQRSSGGNYPAITPDEIDNVLIPVPKDDVQANLIQELEHAQTERKAKLAQADALLSGIDDLVLAELGLPKPTADSRLSYAVRLDGIKARLNAEYYHPERVLAVRAMEQAKSGLKAARLEKIADFKRDTVKVSENDKYLGLASIEPNTGELTGQDETATGQAFTFQKDDVLFSRLRPYLNKVRRAEEPGICSTEFYVIRIKEGLTYTVLPEYLACVLRSSPILAQTRRMMTGNTHPRLANDDVVNLVVPIPAEAAQRGLVDDVGKRKEQVRRVRAEAAAGWTGALAAFEARLIGDSGNP